jgi:queuine tRNA-ribosyltransferase
VSLLSELRLSDRSLPTPAFLPDATRGVVRCIDSADLRSTGIRAVCVNAFHLSRAPGIDTLAELGGIRPFARLDAAVFSDSGGFQVLSLAEQREWSVSVARKGIRFKKKGEKDDRLLTPEKSIQHQWKLGGDGMVALDFCAHPSAPRAEHETSVAHTIDWAQRSAEEYARWRDSTGRAPLLFGVVQGGPHDDLRRRCLDALLECGFTAFGFGGWPIGDEGELVDAVFRVAEMVPEGAPLWGLGIGRPDSVRACVRAGYSLFDCTLPTRDARRGRAFRFGAEARGFEYVYVDDDVHRRVDGPLDPSCDASCCRDHSLALLRHLREVEEPLADRLLTIHNLRFFARWMARL